MKKIALIVSILMLSGTLVGCSSSQNSEPNSSREGSSHTYSAESSESSAESETSEASEPSESSSETQSSSESTSSEIKEKTEAEKIADTLSNLIETAKISNDEELLEIADSSSDYIEKIKTETLSEKDVEMLKPYVNNMLYMCIEDIVIRHCTLIAPLDQKENADLIKSMKLLPQMTVDNYVSSGKHIYDYLEKIYPDGTSISAREYYTALGTIYTERENKENGNYISLIETNDGAMIVFVELPLTWSAEQIVAGLAQAIKFKDIMESKIDTMHYRFYRQNGELVAFMSLKRVTDGWVFLYPLVWFDDEAENYYNSIME